MAQTNEQQKLKEITFIDIETIPRIPEDRDFIDLFEKRFKNEIQAMIDKNINPLKSVDDIIDELHSSKAALYAEFGQVISVAIGRVTAGGKMYIKIIANDDERLLLSHASAGLEGNAAYTYLCAHNGLEFDFPFL